MEMEQAVVAVVALALGSAPLAQPLVGGGLPPAESQWQVKSRGTMWRAAEATHELASKVYAQEVKRQRCAAGRLAKESQAALNIQAWWRRQAPRRSAARHLQQWWRRRLRAGAMADVSPPAAAPELGPPAPSEDQQLMVFQWKADEERTLLAKNVLAAGDAVLKRLKAGVCSAQGCGRALHAVEVNEGAKRHCRFCREPLAGFGYACSQRRAHYTCMPCGGNIVAMAFSQELNEQHFACFANMCGIGCEKCKWPV